MILGIMSDTHGNMELMQRAADMMVDDFGAEMIIHLGDDYADPLKMNTHGAKLYAVPGIYEAAWNNPNIPRKLTIELGGIVFLLSHTPDDNNPQVLLHGHTHKYKLEQSSDGLITINPGHLKSQVDRTLPPTFAIVEIQKSNINAKIVALDGETIAQKKFKIK